MNGKKISVKWLAFAFTAVSAFTGDRALADVKDTANEEQTCKEIGFRPKTIAFGDCVLELLSRREGSSGNASSPVSRPPTHSIAPQKTQYVAANTDQAIDANLTPNGRTCSNYGFKPKSVEFGQCLLQLDEAQRQAQLQQQQYNLQLAQYQQQLAAYNAQQDAIKRERNRRQGELLMRMGAGMVNSKSPTLMGGIADGIAAANGAPISQPIPPSPPAVQNYTIRMPSGTQVYCNYNALANYMSCR